MKTQGLSAPGSMIRVAGLLALAVVLADANRALAQDVCPVPPGLTPPPLPSVTAQQVENGTASLKDFVLAAREQARVDELTSVEGAAYFGCLIREDDSAYRSGSTYLVTLTPDGRVYVHSKAMALSGRLLNPLIIGEIFSALGVPPTVLASLASPDPTTAAQAFAAVFATLAQEPDGRFDATAPIPGLRPGIPGASGHAAVYLSAHTRIPTVLLAGFDVDESHVVDEVIDYGNPAITAKDVKDRETLKGFVTEAVDYIQELLQSRDDGQGGAVVAASQARIALRDPNGPWRHGNVYLYILHRTSNIILFHGAFPDRFEIRPLVPTVRDVVTGELVLPQVLEAATSSPEGGFLEYYWDDPSDDTDSADIPKVGYAREYSGSLLRPDGTRAPYTLVIGSGFYTQAPGGPMITRGCSDRNIAASAVRTQSDVRSFVECAAEYLAEHGTAEARRAFNEDERWKHGPTYVFVDGIAKSGTDAKTFVYPPDPSREGGVWGVSIDDFGNDLFYEIYRMTQVVDAGWTYYSFPNPATGRRSPKASYVIETDWDGEPAVIGAGIYSRDWPGTCYPDEVSAEVLHQTPSPETLREFVRCAAQAVEADGYFAKREIERDPRWTDGQHYVYVLDMLGNQVMSGQPLRINGRAPHEWGRAGPRGDQFGGRDMVAMGDTFGESYVYYQAYDPRSGTSEPKLGFLKRVVAQGVPLLVGAGHHVGHHDELHAGPSCAENYVTAAAVRTQADIPAFVRCAAEYVHEHGEEEARRAFNEDARWKSGPTYLFVDGVQPSGETALTHVFPPEPDREGSVWGTSIDTFGSDYYYELHRILSLVDAGWIYYAFNNPAIGRSQPKSSYVMEIEWNGERAAIGAGIYARDFPGNCDPSEVNAADLAAHPGDQRLQEFVRCAAMEVESSGYFAGPVLSSDPRWKHGPSYVFGANPETGAIEFSGNPASFAVSVRGPQLLFGGRDVIEAVSLFGESFWYINFNNPATGEVQPKVVLYKLVRAQGVPLVIGSGYNP